VTKWGPPVHTRPVESPVGRQHMACFDVRRTTAMYFRHLDINES
jgi:hypothetical protein